MSDNTAKILQIRESIRDASLAADKLEQSKRGLDVVLQGTQQNVSQTDNQVAK
jgi:hypothetical protein